MSTLANQLAAAEREEVARAVRLLLARPLLTEASDPAGFELVRRRREPLAQWFDYTCGWSLVVEPRRGYARLAKVRADPDGSRPARRARSGRAPFDRRRYVLLCVTAAELLSMPMTTIGMLADRVVRATAADRALPAFDPVHRAERMAFVDVLKLLESYDVLRAVDGATEAYVASVEAKVLYRVDTTLLMRLPAAPVGASASPYPRTRCPRGSRTSSRAWCASAATAARSRRRDGRGRARRDGRHGRPAQSEAASLGAAPPLRRPRPVPGGPRRRRAGVRHLPDRTPDPAPLGRTGRLPPGGTRRGLPARRPGRDRHRRPLPRRHLTARVAALLLLEPLCAAPAGLLPEQLAEAGTGLLRRFPRWAKAYQSEDGAARLTDDAVRVLRDVGLAHRAGGRVVARPAAHRYRLTETTSSVDRRAEGDKQ